MSCCQISSLNWLGAKASRKQTIHTHPIRQMANCACFAYPVGEECLDLPLLEVGLVGEARDGVPAEGEARRPLRVARLHLLHPEHER